MEGMRTRTVSVFRWIFEPRTSRILVHSFTTPITHLFITEMIINSHNNNNKSQSIAKRNAEELCSPRAQFSMTRDCDAAPLPPSAGVPTKSIEGRSSRKDAAIHQETLQGPLFYWHRGIRNYFHLGRCR
jgi:hypothetical protein